MVIGMELQTAKCCWSKDGLIMAEKLIIETIDAHAEGEGGRFHSAW